MRPATIWNAEAVAMLILGMSLSVFAGALATGVVKDQWPKLPAADQKYYAFILSTLFFQGAALGLTGRFLRQHQMRWREFFGWPDPGWRRAVAIGVLTAMLAVPLANTLNDGCRRFIEWLQRAAATPQPSIQVLQMIATLPRRVWFGLFSIVLAPLAEEILFRGIAYKWLHDCGWPRFALVASSLLFGAVHVNLMTLLPLTIFGGVLALLYKRTGLLIAPVIAHAVFNAINFTWFLIHLT